MPCTYNDIIPIGHVPADRGVVSGASGQTGWRTSMDTLLRYGSRTNPIPLVAAYRPKYSCSLDWSHGIL